ncbi:MAG: hypothetical protein CL694_11345 [Chloroflexi bacterium]|jgi:hypothetical protein|nr:hypothetical protein [Chloroflexota bacterium]HAL46164.1 hypothetical protein [Dehalococcoidia bacterium]
MPMPKTTLIGSGPIFLPGCVTADSKLISGSVYGVINMRPTQTGEEIGSDKPGTTIAVTQDRRGPEMVLSD